MGASSESGPAEPGPQERAWADVVARVRAGDPELPFARQLAAYRSIYARRAERDGPPPAWWPGPEQRESSHLARWLRELGLADYAALHRWSVERREEFWERVVRDLGIVFAVPPSRILDLAGGPLDPRWLPGARMNCVDSCFSAPGERPAVITRREGSHELVTTSYAELRALVDAVAHGFSGLGLRPGDAVGLYMPLNLECVAAYLGLVRAGCRVVSIADSFPPAELARRLEIGNARAVVTVDRFVRAGQTFDLYARVREADAPRAIVIHDERAPQAIRGGDLAWSELLGSGSAAARPFASAIGDPYDVTNVLFSSGTTGTPKAIPWTHLTPIKCAMDGRLHQDVHPGDVLAWPTNIGWMMGPWLIYAALYNGAALALYEGAPTGAGFARFVRDAGVTMLGVVPSLVRAWRAAGDVAAAEWSGVRVFSSTGEPSNREDYLWLMSRAGYRAPVIEYCGGTEIGGGYVTGTVLQPACPATFTTPALGLELAVLDEAGRPVAEGETGEVFLIPPSIGLSQTLLNRDHTAVYHAGCPPGPGGAPLRRHGDRLVRLARGFYRAQGRADDTMNLGGIKVGSLELERVLGTHPELRECAAVAVQPGGEGAEKLVVWAVPRDPTAPPDRERLRRELGALLASRLNPLFKIHDVVIVGRLPYTASNKLMRRELRAQYTDADEPA